MTLIWFEMLILTYIYNFCLYIDIIIFAHYNSVVFTKFHNLILSSDISFLAIENRTLIRRRIDCGNRENKQKNIKSFGHGEKFPESSSTFMNILRHVLPST